MEENVPELGVPMPPDRNLVDQALAWIGFGMEVNHNIIRDEAGLEDSNNFIGLTEKNIWYMASGFSKRTTAQGCINFGMWRVKYTLVIMHWSKNESRYSRTASLTGITDAEEYKALLGTALDRAKQKKVESDQAETIRKAAYPGEFKDKHTWTECEVKLKNYLYKIPGVNGVPLSYVMQSQAAPDCTTYFQSDFIDETISWSPLSSAHFQADTSKIHQLLNNYLVAETSEQWISSIKNPANGQDDFDALHHHYSGKGNVSQCVEIIDCIQETLH